MKLNDLRFPSGTVKPKKRVGRGTASGHGKTSGRGMKGQKARAGGNIKPGFEGGQLPLYRRLPQMRGFHNIFRVSYSVINLERLAGFKAGAEVDPVAMAEAGLVKSPGELIKVLGDGELKKALRVSAHKFSASAKQKIEAAGGTVVELEP